jgi:small subunit ribosomal protein S21
MACGVIVQKGNIDKALKIFREKVKSSRVLENYKKRKEYVKPSVKKRQAYLKSKYRQDFLNENTFE